jgi:hypothetical protein
MGLDRDGHSKILDDDGQDGGTKGSVVLDGPQGGTEAAEKSRGIDGCKDFLLDGVECAISASHIIWSCDCGNFCIVYSGIDPINATLPFSLILCLNRESPGNSAPQGRTVTGGKREEDCAYCP